jgi:hypothetical protein
LKDRPTWRDDVKERIAVAHKFGVPDETVRAIATKVGEFLGKKACPTTEEEKLLRGCGRLLPPTTVIPFDDINKVRARRCI